MNLIEWPERLGTSLPSDRLDLYIEPQDKPTPPKNLKAYQERETFVEEEGSEGQGDDKDDGGEYVDDRCRAMELTGYGPRWQAIVEDLRSIFGQ